MTIDCMICHGKGWHQAVDHATKQITPKKCSNCNGRGYFLHPLEEKSDRKRDLREKVEKYLVSRKE